MQFILGHVYSGRESSTVKHAKFQMKAISILQRQNVCWLKHWPSVWVHGANNRLKIDA